MVLFLCLCSFGISDYVASSRAGSGLAVSSASLLGGSLFHGSSNAKEIPV